MPRSKHRRTRPNKNETPRLREPSPTAVVDGVVGGNRIVKRAELSRYVELRLQAFLADELQPMIAGLVAEIVTPLLPSLVAQSVEAFAAALPEQAAPGQLVGLDGAPLEAQSSPRLVVLD